jgi:histidinol-phosphate aminotransferase
MQPRRAISSLIPYSPGKPIWEVQQERGIHRVIKLASNENPLGPSPLATAAVREYVSEIHRYPDAGAVTLRESIASAYGLAKEQIIVSNGADELITLLSEAYLEEGDEVIVPAPSFTEYDFGAKLMGAAVVYAPLTDTFEYDADALLRCVSPRTKAMYICSPNNPTGTYMKKGMLEQLLHALPASILVVMDAAYSHYAEAGDYTNGLEFVQKGYPVLVMQTCSKIFGLAGLRVGFGLASAGVIRSIEKVREPFNVNALAQAAASAALRDVIHVERSRRCNAEGRSFLYDAFQKLGIRYTPTSSNFILIEIGPQANAVNEQLLQQGIIVRPGSVWGLAEHFRITIGTSEENQALICALGNISR